MVVLRPVGGLGNQIWVRSFGYALEALGNEVVFDCSYFDTDDTRAYALDRFPTNVVFGKRCGHEIAEPDLRYHPELLKNYDEDVTISGYFQCPRYLQGIEDKVQDSFSVPCRWPSEKTLAIRREIENSNSCCLHVRRTDTLSERGLINHGLVSGEYYGRAIDYISTRVQNPHFFIFSDDIEWCKKNISELRHPITFVDHNTTGVTVTPDFEVRKTDTGTEEFDLWLMSLCKHAVLANSSFGWWAGWLNQNPDKIVIVPKKWFVPSSPHDSTDMFPDSWVKLA